jgi:hypothetical protein
VVEEEYKPWLHNPQNAGISKKKKAKPMSRQQKLRQQRALEKADVNVDKLERKVEGSKARAKRVQHRAKGWEELNAEVGGKKAGKVGDEVGRPDGEGEGDESAMEDVKAPDSEPLVALGPAQDEIKEAVSALPEVVKPEEDIDEIT